MTRVMPAQAGIQYDSRPLATSRLAPDPYRYSGIS